MNNSNLEPKIWLVKTIFHEFFENEIFKIFGLTQFEYQALEETEFLKTPKKVTPDTWKNSVGVKTSNFEFHNFKSSSFSWKKKFWKIFNFFVSIIYFSKKWWKKSTILVFWLLQNQFYELEATNFTHSSLLHVVCLGDDWNFFANEYEYQEIENIWNCKIKKTISDR